VPENRARSVRGIDRIVIHHSASPRETTVEEITKWHVEGRGWDAIGYHLVVTGSGAVRAGRDLRVPGAHAKGYNLGSIGVCVTGNNVDPEHVWSEAQVLSLRAVVRALLAAFPGAEVFGHRDLSEAATECPGLDVRALLAKGE